MNSLNDNSNYIDLVSQKFSINKLQEEYQKGKIKPLVDHLATRFSHIRKIRGQGDCAVLSIIVLVLELIIFDETFRTKLVNLILNVDSVSQVTKDTLAGFILEDEESKDEKRIEEIVNNPTIMEHMISDFRQIASKYLFDHTPEYLPFFPEGTSIPDFCRNSIEKCGVEFDGLALRSLIESLDLTLPIVEFQGGQDSWNYWELLMPENGKSKIHKFWILHRPGHYDVVYRTDPSLSLESKQFNVST